MAAQDPCETPRIIQVADGFYVRQAVDNMAWIDLGDYAIVVDALEQPELEDEVVAALRKTLGDKPVRYVLNTHGHYDHVALNEALRRRYGAEVISHTTRAVTWEGVWFEGPRRKVRIFHTPGCHTEDDCCVWAPAERALFVGDIFGWGLIPLTEPLTDKTAALLLSTYGWMIDYDAAVVVPGHGPLCATAELRRWVRYFRWLVAEVGRAIAAGRTDAQIILETPSPADMAGWWRFTLWKHADSLEKVVKALRGGRLSRKP